METYSVSRKFSRHPAGRFYSDGPSNGQKFRDEVLEPIIKQQKKTKIIFDGARGAGSSFLEEAFGGLVRLGYTKDEICNYIIIESTDPTIADEIFSYIDDASQKRG